MIDKRQQIIKERIQKFAMDLWNIADPRQVDPVIDLILDVIAYNSSRLYQSIDNSDSSILQRLARLLVPHKWSLPSPSHALMSVEPKDNDSCLLTPMDFFHTRKMIFDKGWVELDFSPLSNYPLFNAEIKAISFDRRIVYNSKDGQQAGVFPDIDKKDEDNVVWVGFSMSESMLRSSQQLVLCILPEDGSLAPFLKDIQAYDGEGKALNVTVPSFPLADSDKYQYFDNISAYYANNYIQIDLDTPTCSTFPQEWVGSDDTKEKDKLVWIKLKFPLAFHYVNFEKVRLLLNTYPVVNRSLVTRRHNFAKQGNIVSLPCKGNRFLLNIESLQDDFNHKYMDVSKHYGENPVGTYNLYFGNLERFDSDNARTLINKLLQLVREDGSAFKALDIDTLTAQLNELYHNIESIEKSVYESVQNKNNSRAFLFTQPYKDINDAEVNYWITDAEAANGLDSRASIYQYNNEKFSSSGLVFQTESKQGNSHSGDQDLINSLRYGLLTRERIVTREDVKSFLLCQLGQWIDSIKIEDGIAISQDVRRGIVRTTEVKICLSWGGKAENIDLPAMTNFLEGELSKRSVSNTPYKIFFV
ncbi:hypothetical protein CUC00_11125 [Prevotella intermedia]|uniref:type VI secretion system baseplate subunit TssF n=1 Tax=Prevotella intermedia TaxID=28131 RepID=UPI000C1BB9E6|nr:type VI secretion system baseplate subunit TssF [Prevotella intermedia]ATV34195.1 hypothetical protein CTM44_10265 [Prevotella intermedia]ATV41652.1 hypothetical protein CUC00_11125 [Prevotella intermedia]